MSSASPIPPRPSPNGERYNVSETEAKWRAEWEQRGTFKVGFDAGLKDVELLFMQSDGGLAGGRHCQCAVHAMYWVVKSGRA